VHLSFRRSKLDTTQPRCIVFQRLAPLLSALLFLGTSGDAKTISDIIAEAKPAVLKLLTFDSENKLIGTGTVFFVSADGVAVTCLHVAQGADHVIGEASNGASYTSTGLRVVEKNSDLRHSYTSLLNPYPFQCLPSIVVAAAVFAYF
jgi:S1-C subfamily serine protease